MADETFGERLRQARRELAVALRREVTQQEVADHLGVTSVTVGRWEDGSREPDFATVARLAAYLKVRAGYLAFGELPAAAHGSTNGATPHVPHDPGAARVMQPEEATAADEPSPHAKAQQARERDRAAEQAARKRGA